MEVDEYYAVINSNSMNLAVFIIIGIVIIISGIFFIKRRKNKNKKDEPVEKESLQET